MQRLGVRRILNDFSYGSWISSTLGVPLEAEACNSKQCLIAQTVGIYLTFKYVVSFLSHLSIFYPQKRFEVDDNLINFVWRRVNLHFWHDLEV